MKCVVVLSGGQDSATCLALAVGKYGADEVAAITFRYGQRHAVEVKYARRLAKRFGVKTHQVVDFGFYRRLTTNALMDESIEIETKKGAKCPTTVVEGRNAFFILAASVWAKQLGAKEIHLGVSEADFSGYPDCRAAFVRAQEKAVRLALDYPIKVVTPFMHKNKAYEWELADRLGILDVIPGDGCGQCPSCKLRREGYENYRRKLRGA